MSSNQSATESRHRTRSLRRLIVVAGTIAALTVLAPTVSASSGHGGREFHLAKVCDDAGCTVTSSTDHAIAEGTRITYEGSSADALVATVHASHGTAVGNCDIASVFGDGSPGHCVFTGGTGSLKHFRITVEVTLDFDTGIWYWDGRFDHCHRQGLHH